MHSIRTIPIDDLVAWASVVFSASLVGQSVSLSVPRATVHHSPDDATFDAAIAK